MPSRFAVQISEWWNNFSGMIFAMVIDWSGKLTHDLPLIAVIAVRSDRSAAGQCCSASFCSGNYGLSFLLQWRPWLLSMLTSLMGDLFNG